MKTSDFDYNLPLERIAQTPIEPRDRSRLMVLDRITASIEHHQFFEILDFLRTGDVLVMNNSRVIPARVYGKKSDTGAKVEMLLLHRRQPNVWQVLLKPGKRVKAGTNVELCDATGKYDGVSAQIIESNEDGTRIVSFSDESAVLKLGEIPLPPYIHVPLVDKERYQTVYARENGSSAAPTAGLHFTPDLLNKVKAKGVQCHFVTLHIGLDTFQPVREDDPTQHLIHREFAHLDAETASALSQAKQEGRRIICVGTTSVRIVEQAAKLSPSGGLKPFEGWVDLFILPGYRFRMVDAMITNFHLPKSTLMMLVSAFAGEDLIKRGYQTAIAEKYRFYSFGDAMLIL